MKRKLLALFLILVLALALTACKDNSKEAETKVGDENL